MDISTRVDFSQGEFVVVLRDLSRVIYPADIEVIYKCVMADEIHHGEETFHILVLGSEFLLIGPFVEGDLSAIEALISDNPQIPVSSRAVQSIPLRYRKPSLLGLKLFPIAGLGFGPVSDLERFHMIYGEH